MTENREVIFMEQEQQSAASKSENTLLENRTIFVSEGINAKVANKVINSLLFLDSNDSSKPIYMYLNSPGGEVNSGFAIYDTMRYIKSEVRVVCTGLTASIATIMLLGAPKEHRYYGQYKTSNPSAINWW